MHVCARAPLLQWVGKHINRSLLFGSGSVGRGPAASVHVPPPSSCGKAIVLQYSHRPPRMAFTHIVACAAAGDSCVTKPFHLSPSDPSAAGVLLAVIAAPSSVRATCRAVYVCPRRSRAAAATAAAAVAARRVQGPPALLQNPGARRYLNVCKFTERTMCNCKAARGQAQRAGKARGHDRGWRRAAGGACSAAAGWQWPTPCAFGVVATGTK